MSLVRVGMSDNKKVSEGWEAVFGSKRKGASTPAFGAKRKGANKLASASKTAATKPQMGRQSGGRPSRTKQKGK